MKLQAIMLQLLRNPFRKKQSEKVCFTEVNHIPHMLIHRSHLITSNDGFWLARNKTFFFLNLECMSHLIYIFH